MKRRVFLIVLDSFGIGYGPDAAEYGDVGSNTLKTISKDPEFYVEYMKKMGLFNIQGIDFGEKEKEPLASFARMQERSKGKDTTVGHWEIAGLISEQAFPTYPDGFPKEVLEKFSEAAGKQVLCNKPYSGTDVIKDFGKEHVETGALIVYTSADSVFQIAAHEEVIPLSELYQYCEIARKLLVGEHGVGRVIARPFVGQYPNYTRTSNRHDYALRPPKDTMMDVLRENGYDTISVGKIYDIFAGEGLQESFPTKSNTDGINKLFEMQEKDFNGLCFVNLVDFDMLYGHRNDITGYAKAAAEFDEALKRFITNMEKQDVLIITADHGCDPGYQGTDHTREYVPMLIYGDTIKQGIDLGTRSSFSDIAKTILEMFGIDGKVDGTSFWNEVR